MTNGHHAPLLTPNDIPAALGLLSRLPIPVNADTASARGASAAWAYPIAGLIIGLIVAVITSLALWVGLPAPIAAAIALAASVIVTGAMHEDGLSDTADGIWGGWDRDRRLEIMKDSHIGVYGVMALLLSILIRWLALSAFVATGLHWPAIIITAMISRAAMPAVMVALPNARNSGLSQTVGRPSKTVATIAAVIALGMALVFSGVAGLFAVLLAALTTLICATIARAKIGGQTGDILGATQQMSEIAVLLALLIAISS